MTDRCAGCIWKKWPKGEGWCYWWYTKPKLAEQCGYERG